MSAPIEDPWRWWRAALAGTPVDSEIGQPRAGFWKTSEGEAIAIWWTDDGKVHCERQKYDGESMLPDQIDELFSWASRYPLTEETYHAVRRGEPPIGYATRLTGAEIGAGTVWSLALGQEKAAAAAAKIAKRQAREAEAEHRRQQRLQRKSA